MEPLYLLSGLIALGVLAQWVAARLRVPAIVLLLSTGLLLGPVFGVFDPEVVFGDLLRPAVSLAVAVVLFEGGLSLKLSEARKLGAPLWLLVIGGLVLTSSLCAFFAHAAMGWSWPTSAVLGSILVVTGPTVIKPLLRQARLQSRPALLLKWESIVNDPLGALLAVIVLEVALSGAPTETSNLSSIPGLILTAGLAGLGCGWSLSRAMDRGWIPEHLKATAILAGVLVVFAGSEALFHEAGLLAVTVMGVVMANLSSPNIESIRSFKENVTVLLVSLLFLVLSAGLRFREFTQLGWGAVLFVLAVLFVVRPLVVWISMGLTKVPWREKLLIGWVAPRGVVAAAMGAALATRLVEAGFEDAKQLVPALFAVILSTVVLHGLSTPWLAHRLRIAAKGDGGLLIVGASTWAVELARALSDAGAEVMFVDSDFKSVSRARQRGFTCVYGDVLSEETLDELPLERITWVLAATIDDHYNALVCVSLGPAIGREQLLQLTPAEWEDHEDPTHLMGRVVWGAEGRFAALSRRFWRSDAVKQTTISEEFQWEDFRAHAPDALPLFALAGDRLRPCGVGEEAVSGERLVYLPAGE